MSADSSKQLSSCDKDELTALLVRNPHEVLQACTASLERILRRIRESGAIASPQYDSDDLRLSASLIYALDMYLGQTLREPNVSAPRVRAVWESFLSTNLPCVLLRFVGSAIYWTLNMDNRDSTFGCLCSFFNIWSHGTVLEEDGDVPVRVPSRDFVSRVVKESRAAWEQIWQRRRHIMRDIDAMAGDIENGPTKYGIPKYIQSIAAPLVMIVTTEGQGNDFPIRTLDSSKIAHVALWTWWFLPFGDVQPDNRGLQAMFTVMRNSDDTSARQFVNELIVKDIGADGFLSKLNRSLVELPDVVGDELSNTLYFMEVLSNAVVNPALSDAFAKLPVSAAVARALQKERDPQNMLPSGRQTWGERQLRRWGACAGIIVNIGKGLATGLRPPTTTDGADIYSIIVYGILVALQVVGSGNRSLLDEYETPYSESLSQWVEHVIRYNRSHSSFPESVVQGLRRAVRTNGYSVLLELRKASHKPNQSTFIPYLLDIWVRLGEELGVAEEVMRKEYDKARTKYCSWRQCQYHTMSSDASLSTCKGCGSAFYCTRTCQLSDWKEHKPDCRRLK